MSITIRNSLVCLFFTYSSKSLYVYVVLCRPFLDWRVRLYEKVKKFCKELRPFFNRNCKIYTTLFCLPLKKPHKTIRLEVHLAEHCNLNCCGCNHFSPLADPAFIDIPDFKNDMERLGNLFSHKCEWIHLMSGEPLLNPEIITLMKITRDNFSQSVIMI